MIATLLAVGLHLVSANDAPVDVFGVTVPMRDVDLLLVGPADRDALREKLASVRAHRAKAGGPVKPLVIVIDISDVSTLLRGTAKSKIKGRAVELTKKQPKGAVSPHFVADHDGSVGRAVRGPHKGLCPVHLGPEGEHVNGLALEELATIGGAAPRP